MLMQKYKSSTTMSSYHLEVKFYVPKKKKKGLASTLLVEL